MNGAERMPNGARWLSRTRLVVGCAGVAAIALMGWLLSPGRSRSVAAPRDTHAAVAVDAAVARREDVPVTMEGLGTVQAFYTVKITARVDGELTKVAFTEGQHVKRGDLLAEIDPRPYQAALDQALATRAKDAAQLANARADLARYTLLAPKHLASQQQLDGQRALVAQLEAQQKADEATIENARTQLSYTRITSPIDGRTGIRLIDPGNIVRAADTTGIVVLTQTQPIAAIVTLPENAVGALSEAMGEGPVEVAALAREGREPLDRGTVRLIDNQIDTTTGTIRLKAVFPNAKERLWPGEFITARVHVSTERNVLTIPATALQRGPDGLFAYVIGPDSKVEPRPLKVGYQSEEVAVIESGLTAGERVATSNFYRLEPGALVRVNQPELSERSEQASQSADPLQPAQAAQPLHHDRPAAAHAS
jgi:membrane fusion protein, multidrug efflux system